MASATGRDNNASVQGVCKTLEVNPDRIADFCVAAVAGVVFLSISSCLVRSMAAIANQLHGKRRQRVRFERKHGANKGAGSFTAWQSRQFYHLGRATGRKPWLVLAITLSLSMGAAMGLLMIRVHGDALTMWLPTNSPSQVALHDYSKLTGLPRPRSLLVLLDAASDPQASGGSWPLRSALQDILALHAHIVDLGLHNVSTGSGLSLSDGVFSPLLLWDYSQAELAQDGDPEATLRAAFRESGLDSGVSGVSLGSMVRLDSNRLEGMVLAYSLDSRAERRSDVVAFERKVRTALADPTVDGIDATWHSIAAGAHVFSESALSDDLDDVVGSDVLMIMISMVIMCAYVSIFLSRQRDALHWRAGLAGTAVLSVVLATIAAFGLAAALGIEYNDNVNLAVFVILGVGIDDAFVIVGALDDIATDTSEAEESASTVVNTVATARTNATERVAERVGRALGSCGSTILLSSLTNTIAFALGARSPLPALQGFCSYAAIGMCCDFLLQITFFVATVALDERRLESRRSVIPCIHVGSCPRIVQPPDASPTSAHGPTNDAKKRIRRLGWRGWPRAPVLIAYAATLAWSIHAGFHVQVGLQASELVPTTAAVSQFFAAEERLFGQAPSLVEVIVQHDPAVATSLTPILLEGDHGFATLERLRGAFYAMDAVHVRVPEGAPPERVLTELWTGSFAKWLQPLGLPPPDQLSRSELNEQLSVYAQTPEAALLAGVGTLYLDSNRTRILATGMRALVDGHGPSLMVQLRSTLHEIGLADSAFAYSVNDIFYEQDAVMVQYAHQSLLAVIAAVLAAVFVLTMSPMFVALMSVCTLSCVAHLIGWMVIVRINLSSISLVPLLLSVGLCIDYCTHIAHAFSDATGSATERTLSALRVRGAAVLHAGISTGLSVLLLAFGGSSIFTTFFWMLLGVVVVGLFHALLVLPAMLSILSPPKGNQRSPILPGESIAPSGRDMTEMEVVSTTPATPKPQDTTTPTVII